MRTVLLLKNDTEIEKKSIPFSSTCSKTNSPFASFLKMFFVSGTFSAEVLAPKGRLPVNIRYPHKERVQVGFTAKHEGTYPTHFNPTHLHMMTTMMQRHDNALFSVVIALLYHSVRPVSVVCRLYWHVKCTVLLKTKLSKILNVRYN